MTYKGKPSSACRTCRQRRIKCDEARPSCIQCKKARRECLGYPDPSDLTFQDQTKAVIQRAKRIHNGYAKRNSASPPLGSSPPVSNIGSGRSLSTATPDIFDGATPSPSNVFPDPFQSPLDVAVMSIIPNPAIPIETRALEFFLTAQLLEPMSHGRVVGHLSFLPPLFSRSLSSSALAKVTTAVSVASFDLVGSSNTIVRQSAYSSYGDAVLALAHATSNPTERLRNETLLACILMVVVESMLAKETSPQQQWATHVAGASNLLRQRGRNNISHDPIARRLWGVVKGFLAQNPANQLSEDDIFASDLPLDGLPSSSLPPPETRLGMLTIGVTKLRDRMLCALTNLANQTVLLQSLIDECQMLDRGLCAWALNLPQSYHYVSVPKSTVMNYGGENDLADDAMLFSSSDTTDMEHYYPDPHLQRLWNSYRAARITVNALLYRATMKSPRHITNACELCAGSRQALHDLANDILASVPRTVLDSRTAVSRNVVSAAGEIALGYYCLWPLFVARGVVILPASTKTRIIDTMRRIIDRYGIRHGKTLLDIGIKHEDRPLWGSAWQEGWVEANWQWAFLYGCGAV